MGGYLRGLLCAHCLHRLGPCWAAQGLVAGPGRGSVATRRAGVGHKVQKSERGARLQWPELLQQQGGANKYFTNRHVCLAEPRCPAACPVLAD
eukprot:g76017.t1